MVNILHHSFIVTVQTSLLWYLLRITTRFIEISEERSSFLKIISCSLIGLLIIAVHNFQTFFDRSFVSEFELIFILKLCKTANVTSKTLKDHHSNKFSLQSAQQHQYVF